MNELFLVKKRINRTYRPQEDSSYSIRFFQDLCTGYSFDLGDRAKGKDFISFEPPGCVAEKLFTHKSNVNFSNEIEQVLYFAINNLLRYGKAYLYLQTEHTDSDETDNSSKTITTSLKIQSIIGYPSKKRSDKVVFYRKNYNGDVHKTELVSDGLIELSLKDIGYRKNYFKNVVKRLEKLDITSSATKYMTESIKGYDFAEHVKHNQFIVLKVTKDIGWYFGTDGLSDSYILFRKIQQDKFKLKILYYLIDKVNRALKKLLKNQNVGQLKIHTKNLNYNQLWNNYLNGTIVESDLRRILFRHH